MSKKNLLWRGVLVLVIASMLLSACGGVQGDHGFVRIRSVQNEVWGCGIDACTVVEFETQESYKETQIIAGGAILACDDVSEGKKWKCDNFRLEKNTDIVLQGLK